MSAVLIGYVLNLSLTGDYSILLNIRLGLMIILFLIHVRIVVIYVIVCYLSEASVVILDLGLVGVPCNIL